MTGEETNCNRNPVRMKQNILLMILYATNVFLYVCLNSLHSGHYIEWALYRYKGICNVQKAFDFDFELQLHFW